MVQQTTVEWLESKLDDLLNLYPTEWEAVNLLIVQAIEMEKEQIEKAYQQGALDGYEPNYGSGEQYYNETFGNK